MTEALNPTMLEEDDAETVLITKEGIVTLTGFHKHLAEMQTNDDTYLVEPCDELLEKYQRWMEVVDQDQFTEPRLAKQLTSSQILNEKYESLVPGKVVHMQFWQRYLFKRALLEDALANAELAERRAKQEVNSTKPVSPRKQIVQTSQPKKILKDEEMDKVTEIEAMMAEEEGQEVTIPVVDDESLSKLVDKELKWETEEDFACTVELSEEEQARLLAEYEQEIQEREVKKKDLTPKKTTTANDPKTNGKVQPKKAPAPAKGTKQPETQKNSRLSQKPQSTKAQSKASKAQTPADTKDKSPKDDSDESWEKEFDLDE